MNSEFFNTEYIEKKLQNTRKGIRIFRTACRKNQVRYSFFDCCVIVIPEPNDKIELAASKCIGEFLNNRGYKRFCVVALRDSLKEIKHLHGYVNTCVVSKEEMEYIMDSFSFCFYSPNSVVLSFDYPIGRNASNILSNKSLSYEDVVKYGVFFNLIHSKPSLSEFIKDECLYIIVYLFRCIISILPINVMMSLYYRYMIKPGKDIYEVLYKKYKDSYLFVAPYSGTGDVYISAMMLQKYNAISRINDYIVTVIGGANRKICSLFGIDSEPVDKRNMGKLVRFLSFVGAYEKDCKLLHHDPPNLSIGVLDKMRNVNGLDFFSMISNGVFAVNDKSLVTDPEFSSIENEIDDIFKKYNLLYNKTVLLAPYNYTLPKMKKRFWERLASKLIDEGYTVCTNSSNNREKTIKGTVPVFIPYNMIVPFLNKAGCIISIRSGLCEVISSSVCKKIILYLKGFDWNGKDNLEYFSLKNMGISNDAIELTYDNDESQVLLADEIIKEYF